MLRGFFLKILKNFKNIYLYGLEKVKKKNIYDMYVDVMKCLFEPVVSE